MTSNPYYFIKRAGKLEPASEWDAERLDAIAEGAEVSCATLKQKRSEPRHRFYWVRLSEIVKATEMAPDAEHLHLACKLGCGYYQTVMTKNGPTYIPDSTSFSKMDEVKFKDYMERADKWLLENLGVGLKDA